MASHSALDYFQEITSLYSKVVDPKLIDDSASHQRPHVGFKLSGIKMLAPMSEVNEVLDMPHLTHLPGVKSWVLGVANSRGKLLPVFDLNLFFGRETENKGLTKQKKVLLIEIGELYAGLLVSDVYGMQYLPDDIKMTPLAEDEQQFQAYSQGTIVQEGLNWLSFSPHALVKNPSFFNAAIE